MAGTLVGLAVNTNISGCNAIDVSVQDMFSGTRTDANNYAVGGLVGDYYSGPSKGSPAATVAVSDCSVVNALVVAGADFGDFKVSSGTPVQAFTGGIVGRIRERAAATASVVDSLFDGKRERGGIRRPGRRRRTQQRQRNQRRRHVVLGGRTRLRLLARRDGRRAWRRRRERHLQLRRGRVECGRELCRCAASDGRQPRSGACRPGQRLARRHASPWHHAGARPSRGDHTGAVARWRAGGLRGGVVRVLRRGRRAGGRPLLVGRRPVGGFRDRLPDAHHRPGTGRRAAAARRGRGDLHRCRNGGSGTARLLHDEGAQCAGRGRQADGHPSQRVGRLHRGGFLLCLVRREGRHGGQAFRFRRNAGEGPVRRIREFQGGRPKQRVFRAVRRIGDQRLGADRLSEHGRRRRQQQRFRASQAGRHVPESLHAAQGRRQTRGQRHRGDGRLCRHRIRLRRVHVQQAGYHHLLRWPTPITTIAPRTVPI